jgi:hypothetical protein
LSAITASKFDGKMFAELTDDDLKEHFLMLSFPDRKRLLGLMTERKRNEDQWKEL